MIWPLSHVYLFGTPAGTTVGNPGNQHPRLTSRARNGVMECTVYSSGACGFGILPFITVFFYAAIVILTSIWLGSKIIGLYFADYSNL